MATINPRYQKYANKDYKVYTSSGNSLTELMQKLQEFLKKGNTDTTRRVPVIMDQTEACVLNSTGKKMFTSRMVAGVAMIYEDICVPARTTA